MLVGQTPKFEQQENKNINQRSEKLPPDLKFTPYLPSYKTADYVGKTILVDEFLTDFFSTNFFSDQC